MKPAQRLTAIIEREDDGFVELCPDLDIASEGASIEERRAGLVIWAGRTAPLVPTDPRWIADARDKDHLVQDETEPPPRWHLLTLWRPVFHSPSCRTGRASCGTPCGAKREGIPIDSNSCLIADKTCTYARVPRFAVSGCIPYG